MADKDSEKPVKKEQHASSAKSGSQLQKKPMGPSAQAPQIASKLLRRKGKEGPDFKGILRLIGKDVDGHMTVFEAMKKVKGIGHNLAHNLSKTLVSRFGFTTDELVGNLNEEQFTNLEDVLKFPPKYGIRTFMLNRQKDFDTGENKHLVMSDLTFTVRQDVVRERDSRSYRGWRHSVGQKVRGQHSRTTGRTGMTVGVLKKAIKAQKAAAATGAQDKAAGGAKEEKK